MAAIALAAYLSKLGVPPGYEMTLVNAKDNHKQITRLEVTAIK